MPILAVGSRVSTREFPQRYGKISEALAVNKWKVLLDAGGSEAFVSNALVLHRDSGAGRHPTSATKQAQPGTQAADEIGLDAMPQNDEADSSSSGEEEGEDEEEEEQVTILFFRTAMSTHTRTFARASTSLEHLLILTLS